jgi:hypothetical protein
MLMSFRALQTSDISESVSSYDGSRHGLMSPHLTALPYPDFTALGIPVSQQIDEEDT